MRKDPALLNGATNRRSNPVATSPKAVPTKVSQDDGRESATPGGRKRLRSAGARGPNLRKERQDVWRAEG